MKPKLTVRQRSKLVKKALQGENISLLSREAGISRTLLYRLIKRFKTQQALREQKKLRPQQRLEMIDRVKSGVSVKRVCQLFGVSRTIFYRWLERYEVAPEDKKLAALWDLQPQIDRYYNQAPLEYEEAVLAAVRSYPELSSHKLVWVLPQIGARPILNNHGVQNVLRRHNLGTYQQRLLYAQSYHRPTLATVFWGTWRGVLALLSSQPEPRRAVLVKAIFGLSLGLFSGLVIFGSIGLFGLIFAKGSLIYSTGTILALMALTFGMLFFLYSLKYYLTIAMVLSFSRKNIREIDQGGKDIGGLIPDLSKLRLERHPFVSIHLATYNEKKVIDRLLQAATSMEYDNYEVILVDDSTDESVEVLNKWRNYPRVKVIHRDSRVGYKGGALQEALKATSQEAEFVIVFDADFVPYPDTIIQFLKYFQSTVGSLSPKAVKSQNIAAVQGYQWHVLNKSENWITRGVRSEYAGSYVMERSGEELYQGLKQISGAVYIIRKDVLSSIGWGVSITEDFELTLRLYNLGYKVVYTPYIQAPSECVSTIKRLIRQRMRWAEGHSHNIKKMVLPLLFSQKLTLAEKFELLYLSPYYLQSAFFILGTLSWFLAEVVFQVTLPFWTAAWGWSLVFTNLLALPLVNMVGLFLEEADEKDYLGLFSFVALSYILAPFQGYAATKGFLAKEEGPWFRTPKTGHITDVFTPGRFYRFIFGVFGKKTTTALPAQTINALSESSYLKLNTANNRFDKFQIQPKRLAWVGNFTLVILLCLTTILASFAPLISQSLQVSASQPKLATVANTETDAKNPPLKETILKNAQTQEISVPRMIQKTTKGGKKLEFIFHQEPRVRIRLANQEIEFQTQTIDGKTVQPKRATIYQDKEVIYEEILKDIDLKYSLNNDLLVEEFILKKPVKLEKIEQSLKTLDVKIISPDPSSFGFYSEDGQEIFRLSQPFAKDNKGEVSNDLTFSLEKGAFGYKLKKSLGPSAKKWLAEEKRAYPVSIDPSVIVSGGIAEAEVQFGGLQRKVVYMSGAADGAAWYAVYNDASDVFYKRCLASSSCDEAADWSAAQDLDTGDADNFNPSIGTSAASGNFIKVFWIDTSGNAIEGRRFDVSTAFPHTLGTLCTSASQGTLSSTFMVSVSARSDVESVVAYSDTNADTEVDVFDITGLNGTCAITDVNPGGVSFGSGITAGDRPVLVPIPNPYADDLDDEAAMIFQDGDLSYSALNILFSTSDDWLRNNLTIASVTDNIYSVTTDGTTIWILTVSGTTATNFYRCCTVDFVETQIDADAGGNNDDVIDIDMFCPTSANCKIVYTDDYDTAAPKLIFVDCNDETCSAPVLTTLDADIGASGDQARASIYCVDDGDGIISDNCKVVYGDDMDTAAPLTQFVDCTNDEDCSTNTITNVDADLGSSTAVLNSSIDCPSDTNCKFVYNDSGLSDLFFVDCPDAVCGATGRVITQLDAAAGTAPKNDLYCVASDNCKIIYHDDPSSDLTFIDCTADEDCSTNTATDIDLDVGTTANTVPVAIDCVGGDLDCKVIYGDATISRMFFVDCPDAVCGATGRTITTIDTTSAGAGSTNGAADVNLDCVSATDCKFIYVGDLSTAPEQLYFIDCDDATCSTGSVEGLPRPRFRGAIQCLTSTNCKFVYSQGTGSTNPIVEFADCDVTNCFPSVTDEPDPWTAQTNVTSVSLTYDSTNSDLYAHVIKDTSEQAYFTSSDATTVSWGAETSYGFTAGDLGHISANESGAGTSQIGVVLRQSANFEFAVVPERVLLLLILLPFLPKFIKKLRRKGIRLK